MRKQPKRSLLPERPTTGGMFRPRVDQDPIGMIQREVFRELTVSIGGKKQKLPAIDAYFSSLSASAAKGTPAATRELMRLMKVFDRQIKTGEGLEESDGSKRFRRSVEEHKKLTDMGACYRGVAYLTMCGSFRRAYERKLGRLDDFLEHIPDYCDLQNANDKLPAILRRLRRGKPKKDYEIGFKRPPVAGQWKKGQCGRLSRPPEPPATADPRRAASRAFITALTQTVTFTADGKPSRRPSLEVAVRQVFKKAMGGDKEASSQVRSMVEILQQEGRLVPPEAVPSRPRRKKMTPEQEEIRSVCSNVMTWIQIPDVKDDLIRLYRDKYGALDEIPTDFLITAPTEKSIRESGLPDEMKSILVNLLERAERREKELRAQNGSPEIFEDVEVLGPYFDCDPNDFVDFDKEPREDEVLSKPRGKQTASKPVNRPKSLKRGRTAAKDSNHAEPAR